MSFAKSEVLSLYRSILRYGRGVKFTDRDFFKKKIRKEFETYRTVENPEEIHFHVERAKTFLANKRVI